MTTVLNSCELCIYEPNMHASNLYVDEGNAGSNVQQTCFSGPISYLTEELKAGDYTERSMKAKYKRPWLSEANSLFS